jgi:hypothetical protein
MIILGVTYWSRRAGYAMWRRYDRGAAREELQQIASFGCDGVRLSLTWEEFQPGAERIGGAAMAALEHLLDTAHSAGLRVVATLFPVAQGGALMIPAWANGPDVTGALRRSGPRGTLVVARPPGATPVLYEGGYRPLQIGDPFDDLSLIEAQRYLVREVIGYFGDHPAIWGWQAGEGVERLRQPEFDRAARAWLTALAEEARRAHPLARLIGIASHRGLAHPAGPRPETLADVCDVLGVSVDPPELPLGRRHSDEPAFLHAIVAGLAQRPAIVAGLGMPTAPPQSGPGWIDDSIFGRRVQSYLATTDEQAIFLETALSRLWRAGAAGVWLAAYADHPEEEWRAAPLDRALRYRTLGIVDASGREKPAAAAVRAFAAELRTAAAQERPIPAAIDAERYWRQPAQRLDELWREFTV